MVKSIVASYESQEKNGHNFRFFINLRRKLSSENFCRKRQRWGKDRYPRTIPSGNLGAYSQVGFRPFERGHRQSPVTLLRAPGQTRALAPDAGARLLRLRDEHQSPHPPLQGNVPSARARARGQIRPADPAGGKTRPARRDGDDRHARGVGKAAGGARVHDSRAPAGEAKRRKGGKRRREGTTKLTNCAKKSRDIGCEEGTFPEHDVGWRHDRNNPRIACEL